MKIYFNGKFLIEKELSKVKSHPILLEETIPFVDYVQFRSSIPFIRKLFQTRG